MSAPLRILVGLAVVMGMSPRLARADDRHPTASLGLTRGDGAEACVTVRELARRVEARLGRATFVSAARAELFVDARLVRAGRGWRATVTASRGTGERVGVRELTRAGGDCHGLDDDLVLVIALVIDPTASPTADPTTDANPIAPPPPRVEHDVVFVPVLAPAPRWGFAARLATAVVGGLVPGVEPGLAAAVAATPPGGWPIELGGVVTRLAHAGDGDRGASVRLALGSLAVCPSIVARADWGAAACAGGAAGAMIVRAHGLAPGGDGGGATGMLFATGRGRLRVAGPLELVLDAGAVVPLVRRDLSFTALDAATLAIVRHELFTSAAVGWIASLGLGMQIR